MHKLLEVRLLGGFSVTVDGQPIPGFRSAKARGLLAYLAAQPDQDHSRDTLATLLWGDLPDTPAKTNLRIELSNLKKVLADHPALAISRHAVCFHSKFATVDVQTFEAAVMGSSTLAPEAQSTHLLQLVAAMDFYAGEFLAGFHVDGAIEFEDWQLITREHLHEGMMGALETLQRLYRERGEWAALADAARRQLALVPWAESAHRNLIQALAAQREIGAALGQYEKCREILRAEIGVEPSLETQAFVERLRNGSPPPAPTVQHNLPQQLKSLVGRKEEITQLHTLVQTEKLVTLLGIGGVGKSHLALAVARHALHDFADGVWFVAMANIEAGDAAPERIALAIAAAIDYPITQSQTPLAELSAALANKRLLLVLDNWDHLIAAAETVFDALLQHTQVHVLATSRARLRIEGEIPIRLDGLPLAEASALFMERARRVAPGFATESGGELDAQIGRVYEAVAGLPLGIELAASWVEHYTVADIARSIAQIEVQPGQGAGMVDRHHKLSSVFEYSWRLLSPPQQQILARLSVFRGGFDREAAAVIAESSLSDLSMLIGHSLVQRVTAGRYDLHPLIQEFASAKLTTQQAAVFQGRHSLHYLSTLATIPRGDLARLIVDFENVRSAWERAVNEGDLQPIRPSVAVFSEFIARFGLMTEGEILFREAVTRFEQDGNNEVVAQLLHQQWRFTRALHGFHKAAALAERVLTTTDNPALQIQAHLDLANTYAEAGAWDQANLHFDSAEVLLKESSDVLAYIRVVETRIHINAIHFRGDFAHGIARLQEMLTLLDTVEPLSAEVEETRLQLHLSLSLLAVRYGDYALSIRCGVKNLSRVTSISHRHKRVWILLDLALAEQFAGLFDDAARHNLEALALAEEISAVDDIGLLSANLCLTLRQTDRLREGLAYGRKGAEVLKSLQIQRQEGQARNRVGHTLLALKHWAEADAAYAEALAVWDTMQHPNRLEAVAGRAVAAFHLNRHDEATRLIEETLSFLEREGLQGIVEPVLLLLNCEEVLRGVGQGERATQALHQAEAWVRQIATRISDDAIHRAFLNRPDHGTLTSRLHRAMAGNGSVELPVWV